MLSRTIDTKTEKQLTGLIDEARRIVVTAHTMPDGDAVGSSLALSAVLEKLGKEVKLVYPDPPLHNLNCLKGLKDSLIASRYKAFAEKLFSEADLIFCMDFNEPKRLGSLEAALRNAKAKKVLIDHHLNPDVAAFNVTVSRPAMSSTSYLLFRVLCGLGWFSLIDTDIADCILAGMMTDTGNFSYNASDPEIYTVVAELMAKGANKERIYRALFDTFSADCLRLNGYALSQKMEVFADCHASLITLSRAELNRFHYSTGDTEGLVNRPLAIPGVEYSAFLREEDGYVKVSMRSLGDFPVNEICKRHFNGGGHKNAAGGEFNGSLEECADLFRSLLPQLAKEFFPEKKADT